MFVVLPLLVVRFASTFLFLCTDVVTGTGGKESGEVRETRHVNVQTRRVIVITNSRDPEDEWRDQRLPTSLLVSYLLIRFVAKFFFSCGTYTVYCTWHGYTPRLRSHGYRATAAVLRMV